MDYKLIIGIIASLITIIAYIPYFRDIFSKKTKPHLYTWLIWGITQGTATVALLSGGGKFGSISLIVGTVLVLFVFLLSFKYGTKDVKRSDKMVLVFALLAIVVWWWLDNPLMAVLMVSVIDGVGYIPTFRKTLRDPLSETLSFWIMMVIINILIIISNAQYNLLTSLYISILLVGNLSVVIICIIKRKTKSKPIIE